MWYGMSYDMECLWPGWTTAECEVVQNGMVKSV